MAKLRPACANGSFRARLKEVDVQPMRGALGEWRPDEALTPPTANRTEEGQTTRHFPEADRQNPPPKLVCTPGSRNCKEFPENSGERACPVLENPRRAT